MNRILVIIDNKENRRLLAQALEQYHEVIFAQAGQEFSDVFDLCIVDGPALERLWQAVQERKALEEPFFLPFLLITPRNDVRMANRHLWRTIDELIISPIEKTELLVRVETLMRTRRLSLELKAANAALEKKADTEQELSELKDLFISTASHELRTPLTAIKAYTDLIARNLKKRVSTGDDSEIFDKYLSQLATIAHQSNRMQELLNQLADYSRLGNEQMQLNYNQGANLVEMVGRVVEQVYHKSPTLVKISSSEQAIYAIYDESRLEQVLINLVNNAIKYSPKNGDVTIGVEHAESQSEAVVWVQDQGVGISAEHQASIFDRFFRIRNQDTNRIEGLGLGLYISHEIIQQHKGRMWLKSTPDVGSTFYFAIPTSTQPQL